MISHMEQTRLFNSAVKDTPPLASQRAKPPTWLPEKGGWMCGGGGFPVGGSFTSVPFNRQAGLILSLSGIH